MLRSFICLAAAAAMLVSASPADAKKKTMQTQNPFLKPYTTKYEIPPFEKISYDDYLPALREGIAIQKAEIDAICNNPAAPTFENTMLAMEESGEVLNKVMLVLGTLDEADHTEEMEAIANEAYPLYQQAADEIMMRPDLFARVKALYDDRDNQNYTGPQRRLIEESYKNFVRQGALLNDADKETLKALNARLTDLYLTFNRNLLNSTNAFALVVDNEADLAGLPKSSIEVAAEEAAARNMPGKWVFTLHAPSRLPFLQYADNRALREKMYNGYMNLASEAPYDNRPVINDILRARTAKARLLGYPTFAAYMTDNVMAKTPEAATNLLKQIWAPAIARVDEEVAEMQALADAEGGDFKIAPWDYYYYAEKVRQHKYNFDENEVRPYFAVDNVRNGIFEMANRLYGVNFQEMPNAPKYHPDVKVYDVTDADGKHLAVFMTDYFSRPTKRQGAWMSELKGSYVDEKGKASRPVIYNVGNFPKPTAETPSLLTLDDVETMFHEFGHGLHGMLSTAKYRSQSGTNVDRDFVELPSQIHEHWALTPELLKDYAHHYQTGEVIPDELIAKLEAAGTHNQGFATTELVGAALLDLYYGALNVEDYMDIDIDAFEAAVAKDLNKPEEVQFRYRSPYFKHIFGSDGYASGYYTYLWAEVLDSDGFDLFAEKGVFDPATAKAFRTYVLEPGGSVDPMELYVKFRGHQPSVDALLRYRGLAPAEK